MGELLQADRTRPLPAGPPLRAGLAADSVAPAQLGEEEQSGFRLHAEPLTLRHGLSPRHLGFLAETQSTGARCYLSALHELSPIDVEKTL